MLIAPHAMWGELMYKRRTPDGVQEKASTI